MRKPRVLIIDDESGIREILSALLKENGYEVRSADSGKAGLDMYAEFLPAVVLLDLKMPEMDGMQVIDLLDSTFGADCKVTVSPRL